MLGKTIHGLLTDFTGLKNENDQCLFVRYCLHMGW